MYFKFSLRHNKEKGSSDAYYRLVESYRNAEGRVCHRTILNIGFLADSYTPGLLNQAARILTGKYEHKQTLFETADNQAVAFAEALWERIVAERRLDISLYSPASRHVDVDKLRHTDGREIGAEAICHHTLQELGIAEVLVKAGFNEEQIQLATTQIISRAVYPASELKTSSCPPDRTGRDKGQFRSLRAYRLRQREDHKGQALRKCLAPL